MDINDFIANRQTCLKWLRMPRLSPAEAAALLLGYDPDQYSKLRNAKAKDLARKFSELEQEVTRQFPRRDARDWSPVRPELLVNWAIEIELELPEPLQGSIDKLFGNRQTSAARPGDLDAQLEALKLENAELTEQVARLEKELSQLKKDEIHPKILTSLLKIILAMALAKYRWKPFEKKQHAAKSITDDALRHGITIDQGTVLKHLSYASDEIEWTDVSEER